MPYLYSIYVERKSSARYINNNETQRITIPDKQNGNESKLRSLMTEGAAPSVYYDVRQFNQLISNTISEWDTRYDFSIRNERYLISFCIFSLVS